jgi:putative CRISPR-associated protein (TIGR02619 family)
LLTNASSQELRLLLSQTANHKSTDLPADQKAAIDEHIRDRALVLQSANLQKARGWSAELNGLVGFYENQLDRGGEDFHLLLHTDTYQGERTATVIQEWLCAKGLRVTTQAIPGLNTADLDSFRSAMNEMVSWCEQTLPGYRQNRIRVVFNLVAGFKAWQGFMQTLGMFYADEILYIFESSDQLLRLPRLPVQFEEAAVQEIRQNLLLFRRLDRKQTSMPSSECEGISEIFLYQVGEETELSPWGRLVWERHKSDFYRQKLLAPISPLLKFGPMVPRTVEDLSGELRERFNHRMDDLARYLDSGREGATQRLDFKQLKGNPYPPSTHECDLWADQGAWRAFGHFDDEERLIIDRIGPGLH